MGKNPKPFRLRSRLREPMGDASEKEILEKIAKGRLSGDEEVSTAPYTRWQPISSHPTFYDAFLKRLHEGEYQPPDDERGKQKSALSKAKGAAPLEGATRQASSGSNDASAEDAGELDQGKTRNNAAERSRIFGATIHQSAIDELFSENPGESAKNEETKPKAEAAASENEPSPGTALVSIKIPADTEPPQIQLSQGLDYAKTTTEEESPEFIARKKATDRKRRLIFVGGMAAILSLLFTLGKSDPPKPKPVAEEEGLKPVIKQVITDAATKEERIRTLLDEGERLYERDMPLFNAGARSLFQEALAYGETNALVLGHLAESSARVLMDEPDNQAVKESVAQYVSRGRASDPQFSQFYRAEALAALASGQLEDARDKIDAALESDPSNSENFLVQGEIFFKAGDFQTAKQSFEEVVKVVPESVRTHHYLARIALEQKDFSRVIKEAKASLGLNPIHAGSYFVLAEVTSEQNRFKEARQLYTTCVSLAPLGRKSQISRAFFRLGTMEEAAGKKSEAQKNFQLAYYYSPAKNEEITQRVSGLDLSDATLKALAQKNQYGRNYYAEQAESLVNQQKLKEALLFLEAASLLDPKDGSALVRLGEVTEKMAASYEDFRAVTSFYQRAIERDPKLTKAYIRLGLLETEQYNLDRAYKLLRQAQALSPDDPEPYVALGKHFYRAKDYLKAVDQFHEAYKRNSEDSEILYYAGLLRLIGKKEGERDAAGLFYRAYLADPQNYDALVEWLKLKVQGYEKNFAVKFVKNLIEQDAGNPNLYWALGEVYAANKEFRRAITFYHQSLDLNNRLAKVRMALGKSLESVGELEKAIAEYRLASFLDRRNSDGFFKAADLLFQMKNYKEAEEVLTFLVNVCPNYPGTHRYLSKIYQLKKQKDQALAEMAKEVQNNPMNTKFRIELAELYMEYDKYEQAVTELTEVINSSKAPELAYDKVRSYLLLSRSYRMLSRYESAEGSIKLALETDPEDPELHRELGYVYHALQRDRESVKAFQFYLSRSPAAADADAIRGLIQTLSIDE